MVPVRLRGGNLPAMGLPKAIRDLVAHCDLEERLVAVPASARLRGLYFRNTLTVLRVAGRLEEFEALYPERYSSIRWYPVSAFLERLAVAGALLEGPENVHVGMQRIGHNNAMAFAESLLGRTMLRLLARDPVRLLRQAASGRRQSCTYGRWELEFGEEGTATVSMFEEYLWIESNVLGAAFGTFHSIGREVDVRVELLSPFNGRLHLTWDAS